MGKTERSKWAGAHESTRATSEFQLLLTIAFRIAHHVSLKEQSLSKAPAGENSDWQGDNH